jgi:hypothetical protein
MPSTQFTSAPTLAKAAVRAIRKWQAIPDEFDDDEVLAQQLISPELLELVMQIITEVVLNCLDNNKTLAWRRVKTHTEAKHLDRLMNNMRLNGLIDRWLERTGIPRERGDVVALRESLVLAAKESNEEELQNIQLETLWIGI